jgi:RHS repeat-associated protein
VADRTAFYLPDALNTVRDIVDVNGNVFATIDYSAFGNVLTEVANTPADRFLFTGREYDSQVQLYYFRARYYDSQTGRFLNGDPIDFRSGDTNVYRYAFNNPASFTDPTGTATAVERAKVMPVF